MLKSDIVLNMPATAYTPQSGASTPAHTTEATSPSDLVSTTIDTPQASAFPPSESQSPPSLYQPPPLDSFEDDIDADPQSHFLTPMASYEYWDDSDSEDGEAVEWDAGIVDFGLFYDDHKNASVPLSSKWDDLLADQTRLSHRANTGIAEPEFLARTTSGDSLPDLTPDSSPHVRNDMDFDEANSAGSSSTPVFKLIVTPPLEDLELALHDAATDDETDEEDYLPLSFFVERHQTRQRFAEQTVDDSPPLRVRRPGLNNDRTLSGKRHSWVKPGRDIWSIREGFSEGAIHEEDGWERDRRTLRRGRSF